MTRNCPLNTSIVIFESLYLFSMGVIRYNLTPKPSDNHAWDALVQRTLAQIIT
jgi:hypothetical protein